MAFSKNELILDRVRALSTYDLETDDMLFRLASLEDPSLNTTAEGEEVVDAVGSVIANLYRAKKGAFSATNSLLSLDLAAAQYGATKEVASDANKVKMYAQQILKVEDGKVKIEKENLIADSVKMAAYNGDIGVFFKSGESASADTFVIAENGEITVPTGVTGKVYVDYAYETAEAVRIMNRASEFPTACKVVIHAIFRDKCNENIVYAGNIVCPKAKLNPEQVELALTSTGKHPFEFTMMKDYCNEDEDNLFYIAVAK